MTDNAKVKLTPLQQTMSGAIAGVVARVVISPIDVIKIRLQTQANIRGQTPKYNGMVQTFSTIVKEEGFRALWKGNWAAELLYLTYGGAQFMFYDFAEKNMKDYNRHASRPIPVNIATFLSGAFAGFGATIATYPFDLMRTRFAMQGNDKVYTSLLQAFTSTVKENGIGGLYRGLGATLLQIMPNMGIMFTAYRLNKKAISQTSLPKGTQEFLAGGMAGIISKLSVMPFDTVRKRLQVQFGSKNRLAVQGIPHYTGGFFSTASQIIKQEGFLGLYKGTIPALLKSAPSSAVIFFVVERCRDFFRRYNERNGTGIIVE